MHFGKLNPKAHVLELTFKKSVAKLLKNAVLEYSQFKILIIKQC